MSEFFGRFVDDAVAALGPTAAEAGVSPQRLVLDLVSLCWYPFAHEQTLVPALGIDPRDPTFAIEQRRLRGALQAAPFAGCSEHGRSHRERRPLHRQLNLDAARVADEGAAEGVFEAQDGKHGRRVVDENRVRQVARRRPVPRPVRVRKRALLAAGSVS